MIKIDQIKEQFTRWQSKKPEKMQQLINGGIIFEFDGNTYFTLKHGNNCILFHFRQLVQLREILNDYFSEVE